MRKMTYTQAATCGENLKVKVTPEQSEKMQRAWFAAGKAWANGIAEICETTECFLYLHDDDDLTAGSSISEFKNHVNTEIELIDDISKYTIDEDVNTNNIKTCLCGKKLTSTELKYYGNSCEECEGKRVNKMRKMTYKEAATCGENLKARVTPEQSEKMQRAWFAAGKRWQNNHTNIVIQPDKTCLFLDGDLSNGDDYYFEQDENEEIELIDDLPQHDFASQQEVCLWVAQGNQVKSGQFELIGFKNGLLWNFITDEKSNITFEVPQNWQKYTPPRIIRVNGVEVPAPLESLDGVTYVYLPNIGNPQEPIKLMSNIVIEKGFSLGICYATKEDAIKRAEAMLKFEVVE